MCMVCDRIEMIKKGENPYFVKELETGYVVIGDHQHFKGYTLFLCKRHELELFDLDYEFGTKYMQEMVKVAKACKDAFDAEKIHYESLGQGDIHLHWHIFPRKTGDLNNYGKNGLGPVWWYPRELMYSEDNHPNDDELESMKRKLLTELDKI